MESNATRALYRWEGVADANAAGTNPVPTATTLGVPKGPDRVVTVTVTWADAMADLELVVRAEDGSGRGRQ